MNANNYRTSYTYDDPGQNGSDFTLTMSETNTNTQPYDPVGNRQVVVDNSTNTAYTANALNQYTAVASDTPSYDQNGNLTGVASAIPGGPWTYQYDAQNRLILASSASLAVSFSYDARNRCVKRVANGTTLYLLYDGWSLIEERDAGDNVLASYIHGAAIDEILVRTAGSSLWYHHDGLGSTTHLTDNTGTVVESYTYDVYGTPSFFDSAGSPQPSSLVSQRFLFTGREYFADFSLSDYRNRMYSSVTGRFMQVDPIRQSGRDINIYRYVFNAPSRWSDPSGLVVGGMVLCDGKGNLKIYVSPEVKNPSVKKCTQMHEQRHLDDITKKYGKDVCKDKPPLYKPGSDDPNYAKFLCDTECEAYQVGVQCLDEEIGNCPTDEKGGLSMIRDSWRNHANSECKAAGKPEPYPSKK